MQRSESGSLRILSVWRKRAPPPARLPRVSTYTSVFYTPQPVLTHLLIYLLTYLYLLTDHLLPYLPYHAAASRARNGPPRSYVPEFVARIRPSRACLRCQSVGTRPPRPTQRFKRGRVPRAQMIFGLTPRWRPHGRRSRIIAEPSRSFVLERP